VLHSFQNVNSVFLLFVFKIKTPLIRLRGVFYCKKVFFCFDVLESKKCDKITKKKIREVKMRLFSIFCVLFLVASVLNAYTILVTNDDSIYSPGIKILAQTLQKAGNTVKVIAPEENQSGVGHAITIHKVIMEKTAKVADGLWGVSLTATPASCVKIATHVLLKQKPDLVISGINKGLNIGNTVWVSGTVGGAREAVLEGIPSIAVSIQGHSTATFKKAAQLVLYFVNKIKRDGLPAGAFLNINVPKNYQGVRVTTLSNFHFKEIWERRKNLSGQYYYWSTIRYPKTQPETGSDWWAINNKFVSVTPLNIEVTAYKMLKTVEKWLSER
jgi:5'-nucleotidase